MILDYGELLSPEPIKLSIGTLKKPTLREIASLTFEKFNYYESFLKLTPELIYTTIYGDEGKAHWESLSDEQKASVKTFHLIISDKQLQSVFESVLNFFFYENVVYYEKYFLLVDGEFSPEMSSDSIRGIISEDSFQQVIDLIQQLCCIYTKPPTPISEVKFKNKLARRLYEKLQKAKEIKKKEKESNKDLALPNIISAVSNRHPSINPVNIWDMTLFQLIDSFNRLQVNAVYDINQLRVSVWGDEKKTFDPSLWYKNNNDN